MLADLRAFLASRGQHRIISAFLAILIPGLIFTAFFLQSRAWKPPERIVYAKMWKADRTDAEIIADQKAAQETKDARAKERQRQFRKLADQLGIE